MAAEPELQEFQEALELMTGGLVVDAKGFSKLVEDIRNGRRAKVRVRGPVNVENISLRGIKITTSDGGIMSGGTESGISGKMTLTCKWIDVCRADDTDMLYFSGMNIVADGADLGLTTSES